MAKGEDTGSHPNRQVNRPRFTQAMTLEEHRAASAAATRPLTDPTMRNDIGPRTVSAYGMTRGKGRMKGPLPTGGMG